ncbi:bleomycin hydrolase [Microbotryomycetes sp. JL201]|nr:bleomycin hydrolase [Microbotryomycetes sp. JL201]
MGAQQSTPSRTAPSYSDDKQAAYDGLRSEAARASSSRANTKAADLLASLSHHNGGKAPATAAVTLDQIAVWDKQALAKPEWRMAQTALHKADVLSTMVSRKAAVSASHVFNIKLSTENDLVSNQKSSGRCWLFAMCNTIRLQMTRKYNLEGFELSQSYLFFYDSLSKANWMLENILELADEDLDSRIVQYLLSMPENDGGQYSMAQNLVEQFGLVPQSVFPESFNSSQSAKLDAILTSKLRQYALELRELYSCSLHSLHDDHAKTVAEKRLAAQTAARQHKDACLAEVYRILVITLGRPPQPDEEFTWEYYDKSKKFHSVKTTPKQFVKNYCLVDVSGGVSLVHDPRNKPGLYTVDRLGNVWGGKPVLYVNTSIEDLKQVAISLLKADTPVWFGCDVGKSSSTSLGILDTNLYDLEECFSTSVKMTKAQRLQTGDSEMTHAMVLTAVHLDDKGKPVRWRVENSWGPDACEKGFFTMTDEWFSMNVYQVVADRKMVPHALRKVFDEGEPTKLPAWDPMGSLAGRGRVLGVI